MPAYSQSTIRTCSPSWRKLALRRSSWQGTGRCSSCPDTASRIAWARASASANSGGVSPPRAVAVDAYSSTTRNESNSVGSSAPESWKVRSARATSASLSGSRSSSAVSSRPGMKRVIEAGRVLDEGRHRRCDAEVRGALVRGALRLAVDAQQRGVLAGQPDHVVGAAEPHSEVAIRDPAVERHHGALARTEERGHVGPPPRSVRGSLSPRASARPTEAHGRARGGCQAPLTQRCAHAPGHRGPPCPRRARGAGAARPSGSLVGVARRPARGAGGRRGAPEDQPSRLLFSRGTPWLRSPPVPPRSRPLGSARSAAA